MWQAVLDDSKTTMDKVRLASGWGYDGTARWQLQRSQEEDDAGLARVLEHVLTLGRAEVPTHVCSCAWLRILVIVVVVAATFALLA